MKKMLPDFNLSELLIMVAVVVILTTIAVPAYQDFIIRTQIGEGASLAEGSKIAIGEFYNKTKRLPAGNASAGLAASIVGDYVTLVNGASGTIVVTYGAHANSRITGRRLIYSAVARAGAITWECRNATTVDDKYRPRACRR